MSIYKSGLFAGKVAIVTGGGTGIGKAIATELCSLGCKVVIASRSLDKLNATADSLAKVGHVKPIQCNIRKEEDIQSCVKAVLSEYGKIDFLVNNGGGQFPSPVKDMSLKGWNAVIETNLTGTYLMSKEVYNQWFRDNGGGAIVNIIAVMFRGFPMMAHTGAARAAVENLSKSLAVEWAEDGVRVNAVAPGVIYSKSASENYDYDVFALAKPGIPAKRLGTPEEVSSAVCFLLSPGSAYVSGITLTVDAASALYSPLMWQISDHDKMPEYKWTDKSKL